MLALPVPHARSSSGHGMAHPVPVLELAVVSYTIDHDYPHNHMACNSMIFFTRTARHRPSIPRAPLPCTTEYRSPSGTLPCTVLGSMHCARFHALFFPFTGKGEHSQGSRVAGGPLHVGDCCPALNKLVAQDSPHGEQALKLCPQPPPPPPPSLPVRQTLVDT